MKALPAFSLLIVLAAGCASFAAVRLAAAPTNDGVPHYTAAGQLIRPDDYREWVFLSSGFDMSYHEVTTAPDAHVFDNVFAPRSAYEAFKAKGVWPDKTVLIFEIRSAASKGSINTFGNYQTGVLVGLEAHVKDTARFKGGWGFFNFEGAQPAALIPASADCYACHRDHAAVDTTFVQFYPTIRPFAEKHGTFKAER